MKIKQVFCLFAALLTETALAQTRLPFGQIQSFIGEWGNHPVVCANWHGRYRPFEWVGGRFVPLLKPSQEGALSGVDLYSPNKVGDRGVLFSGQIHGAREFGLYFWDAKTRSIQPWQPDPHEDLGGVCVSPSGKTAYHSYHEERVAQLDPGVLKPVVRTVSPLPFDRCAWLDDEHLVGLSGGTPGEGSPPNGYSCKLNVAGAPACAPLPFIGDFEVIGALGDRRASGARGLWFSGRKRGEPFRRIFLLDEKQRLEPLTAGRSREPQDELFFDDDKLILAGESHYQLNSTDDPDIQIYRARVIGGKLFSVAADATHPRSLAARERDHWKFLGASPLPPQDGSLKPKEVRTRDTNGFAHQSFYWGKPGTRQVVVWFHGGPHENVSARYSPYFAELNALGWGVLAVNYPGSTGRGASYELSRDPKLFSQGLESIAKYLQSEGIGKVVLWSVSSGADAAEEWLAQHWPVSGWIDQVAVGHHHQERDPEQWAKWAQVRYFKIRGKNDPFNPHPSGVDFPYDDGHDIVLERDFRALFRKLTGFLGSLTK